MPDSSAFCNICRSIRAKQRSVAGEGESLCVPAHRFAPAAILAEARRAGLGESVPFGVDPRAARCGEPGGRGEWIAPCGRARIAARVAEKEERADSRALQDSGVRRCSASGRCRKSDATPPAASGLCQKAVSGRSKLSNHRRARRGRPIKHQKRPRAALTIRACFRVLFASPPKPKSSCLGVSENLCNIADGVR